MIESEMIQVIVSWTGVNIRGCNLGFSGCKSNFVSRDVDLNSKFDYKISISKESFEETYRLGGNALNWQLDKKQYFFFETEGH